MAAANHEASLVYAGFWIRVWASIIDSVLVLVVLFPLLSLLPGVESHARSGTLVNAYGSIRYDELGMNLLPGPLHVFVFWILPALVIILFWMARAATPGKMAIGARIVDAGTGEAPGTLRWVLRYLGYFVSTFPFCLGLIWVGLDSRKQGWHDKIAGTVVVRRKQTTEAVHFAHAPEQERS